MTERQTLCETLRANDFDEAADEIERLRADFEAMKTWALDSDDTNDRLRAALKPFASCVSDQNGEWVVVAGMAKPYDYLCAYRALEQREGTK